MADSYFRNALVRANYNNLQKGIHETTEYLERFLRNLLLNEHHDLRNRDLHVSGLLKVEKVDIEAMLQAKGIHFTSATLQHIRLLLAEYGLIGIFGRSDVKRITGLKDVGASKFLKRILEESIIEPVSGHGKGKYRLTN